MTTSQPKLDTISADVMTTSIVTIQPNALIEDALDMMIDRKISGLPVVDAEGELVGLISEFDCLTLLLESDEDARLVDPVAHFMSVDVMSIQYDVPIEKVAKVFQMTGVRRLPVVDGKRLVGIISRRDLLREIRDRRRDFDFGDLDDVEWEDFVQAN